MKDMKLRWVFIFESYLRSEGQYNVPFMFELRPFRIVMEIGAWCFTFGFTKALTFDVDIPEEEDEDFSWDSIKSIA